MSLSQVLYNVASAFRTDSSSWKQSFQRIFQGPWLADAGRDQLVATVGLAHRLVWSIPEDCLSQGWATDSDQGTDLTRDLDAPLGIEGSLKIAYGAARQDCRSWIWAYAEGPQDQPLRGQYTRVVALHTLTDSEVNVVEVERDPASRNWGKPKYLSLRVSRNNMFLNEPKVHHSRLIRVSGAPATPDTRGEKLNGEISYLQLYLSAIEAMESGWASAGQLNRRIAMPWVRLKAGHSVAAADAGTANDGDSLAARMQLLKDGMEDGGLMLLCGDDEIGWTAPGLAGLRDLTTTQAERISSVEGIPLSVLLGQPPGGLSTDDASAKRNYNRILQRKRRCDLEPVLLKIYEAVLGPDRSRRIVWPSLEDVTSLEKAQISLTYAQRDVALNTIFALSVPEIRSRFEGGEEKDTPILEEKVELPSFEEAMGILPPIQPPPVLSPTID